MKTVKGSIKKKPHRYNALWGLNIVVKLKTYYVIINSMPLIIMLKIGNTKEIESSGGFICILKVF